MNKLKSLNEYLDDNDIDINVNKFSLQDIFEFGFENGRKYEAKLLSNPVIKPNFNSIVIPPNKIVTIVNEAGLYSSISPVDHEIHITNDIKQVYINNELVFVRPNSSRLEFPSSKL